MLRRKALKKIIMTTFSVFIILLVYLIPDAKIKDLPTNLDIEYVTNIATNSIYLLNNNNYLVKTNILIDETDLIKKIEKQVKALIISKNNSFPKGLKALIPLDTKLLDVVMEEKIAILNFSKEFLSISKELESSLIEAIVFSVLDFDEVEGIKIKIEGQDLTKLPHSLKNIPEVLTKEIGINRVYSINSRNDIQKIVIYYVEDIEGKNYYVPITKYLNDTRDKIKIVMANLTTDYIYEKNLMSLLSKNVSLLDYKILEKEMILNFNDAIFNDEKHLQEEVLYTVCSSVFANYDINEIIFKVNGEQIKDKCPLRG